MLTTCPFPDCDRVGIHRVKITGRHGAWPAEIPPVEWFLEGGFCPEHVGEIVSVITARQPYDSTGPLASLMRDPDSTIVVRVVKSPDLN